MREILFFKDAKPITKLVMLLLVFVFFTSLYGFVSSFLNINFYLSQSLFQIIIFGISVVVWGYMFESSAFNFVFLERNKPYYYIVASILLVIISLPIIDGVSIWNESWDFSGNEVYRIIEDKSKKITNSLLGVNNISALMINLLVFALIPSIVEEYFFRGGMQKTIINIVRNEFLGIFITAVFFSLAHLQLFSFMPRVLLGLLLGYLYVFSKNIFIPIIFHFINNSIGVIGYYLFFNSYSKKDYTLTGAIYSPLYFWTCFIIIFLFFFLEIRKRRKSRIFVKN